MFLSCLQDAITRSEYESINLKPKQVVCLEALFNNKDTLAVLPTGYGKSLLYKVLPVLLAERNTRLALIQSGKKNETSGSCSSIVLVVCPINSLIDDQLRKINERSDLSATALKVNVDEEVCFSRDIEDATFDIVFLHPEACLSSNCGFKLLRSEPYQKAVQAIVIDEAHCILEW